MPDKDRAQDRAERRQRERAERNEHIVRHFEQVIDDVTFPANTAEIRAQLRDAPDEVGETESLGSVLDRLEDEYATEQEAREAFRERLGEAEHAEPADTEREEVAETRREQTGNVADVDGDDGGEGGAGRR